MEIGVHADAAALNARALLRVLLLQRRLGAEPARLLRVAEGDDFDVVERRVLPGLKQRASAGAMMPTVTRSLAAALPRPRALAATRAGAASAAPAEAFKNCLRVEAGSFGMDGLLD